jgi:hypothetical protein
VLRLLASASAAESSATRCTVSTGPKISSAVSSVGAASCPA